MILSSLLKPLSTAIKKGILRIFPLPLKPCLYALAILTLLTVYGCATPRHTTQLVRNIQRDTVYLSNTQYDSIYIFKDKLTDRSKDTIYVKDISAEYRYKMLRDTVKIIQRDSIPYEVTVIQTKEIQRPLTWFDHLTRLTFWFVVGFLICAIYFKLKSINHNPKP